MKKVNYITIWLAKVQIETLQILYKIKTKFIYKFSIGVQKEIIGQGEQSFWKDKNLQRQKIRRGEDYLTSCARGNIHCNVANAVEVLFLWNQEVEEELIRAFNSWDFSNKGKN